jgi:hypothetical protein
MALSAVPHQILHYPMAEYPMAHPLPVPLADQTRGEQRIGPMHLQEEPLVALGNLPQGGIQKVGREVVIT